MMRFIKSFVIMGLVLITGCSNSDKTAAEVQPTVVTEVADCQHGGACQVGELGDGQWFGGQVLWVDKSDPTNYLQHGVDISTELYGESMIAGENTKFQVPAPWCRYDPVTLPASLSTADDGSINTSNLINNCFSSEEDFNNSYGSVATAIFNMNHQGSGVNWDLGIPWSSWGATSSWYVPTRLELVNIFESYKLNRHVFDIEFADGCYWSSERATADTQMFAMEYSNGALKETPLIDISRCFVIPIRKNPYHDPVTVEASNRSSANSSPSASATSSLQIDDSLNQLNFASVETFKSIIVGKSPSGIAVDRSGKFALVANYGSKTVSRIDLSNNLVVATINIEGEPRSIVIDPDGKFAYVTTYSKVAKINLAIDSVTASIEVGDQTDEIIIDDAGRFAYTVGGNPSFLSQIDLVSGTMTHKTRVFGQHLTLDPSGNFLYVMNTRNNSTGDEASRIAKFDLTSGKVVAYIKTDIVPGCMVINREGTYAYVNDSSLGSPDYPGRVIKIDLATNVVVKTLTVGMSPECLSADPSRTFIYVPDITSYSISKINLATDEVKVVPENAFSHLALDTITFNPNGKFAYASGPDGNTIVIIGK